MNDRPRPTSSSTATSSAQEGGSSNVYSVTSTPVQDHTSDAHSGPIEQSNVPSNNVTSSSLRLNVLQDSASPPHYNLNPEPDRIYEIPVGAYSVQEPPETIVNDESPSEAAAPHLNGINYQGGDDSSNVAPLSAELLPPLGPETTQEQSTKGGYLYPSPCSTTSSQSVPCLIINEEASANEIDVTSTTTTTQATYLPPYEPEEEIQGPFVIGIPETSTPESANINEENKVTEQNLPCGQTTETSPKPTTTTTVAPCQTTTTPKPTTTTTTVAPCQTTTTPKPTTTTTTTTVPPCQTTTEKPTTTKRPTTTTTTTTTVRPTTTTALPCYTTTTSKPTTEKPSTTTKPPCQKTTKRTTTKPPCHLSSTSKPSTLPCRHQHTKPTTEPSWTYLPPHKVTTEPNYYHTNPPNYYLPPSTRKPLFYLPPKDPNEDFEYDHQPFNHKIHFRSIFRHHSKFLFPLKRLLGLA